jgi:hypothetical protein
VVRRDFVKSMIKKKAKKIKPFIIVILSVIVVAIIFSVIFYIRSSSSVNNPQASIAETKNILDEVGKLIILPKDEMPIIATVTDLDKLKGQSFFANAKIGDKVLIYNKSEKAILYDPVLNKIVEIAPINTSFDQVNSSTSKSTSKKI